MHGNVLFWFFLCQKVGIEGLGCLCLWIKFKITQFTDFFLQNSWFKNLFLNSGSMWHRYYVFWEVWWMLMTLSSSTTTTKVRFKYQVSLWSSFCGKKSSEIRFLQTQKCCKKEKRILSFGLKCNISKESMKKRKLRSLLIQASISNLVFETDFSQLSCNTFVSFWVLWSLK